MYVINVHTRSYRQMHGGIQCIWYCGCLLEETKEVVLIVAILSFDMKQIKKGRNNYIRISIVNLYCLFQVFRNRKGRYRQWWNRVTRRRQRRTPPPKKKKKKKEEDGEAWAQGFTETRSCWRSGWYSYYQWLLSKKDDFCKHQKSAKWKSLRKSAKRIEEQGRAQGE